MSDSESVDSSVEHQHMVGDMDIDLPSPPVGNAKTDSSQEPNRPSHDGASDGDEEEEDEETRRENRRRRAEKRKGKRPEQTAQQKADARAARRRARAEADEEAYREAYRPILTIKHSQGFVWNQDLFVPAWQKDRYLCSTSPPSAAGQSVPPTSSYMNGGMGMDYEVECVEIRIREGELDSIIPRSR